MISAQSEQTVEEFEVETGKLERRIRRLLATLQVLLGEGFEFEGARTASWRCQRNGRVYKAKVDREMQCVGGLLIHCDFGGGSWVFVTRDAEAYWLPFRMLGRQFETVTKGNGDCYAYWSPWKGFYQIAEAIINNELMILNSDENHIVFVDLSTKRVYEIYQEFVSAPA